MKWKHSCDLKNSLTIRIFNGGSVDNILDPYNYSRLISWFYQNTLYNPFYPSVNKDPFYNYIDGVETLFVEKSELDRVIDFSRLLEKDGIAICRLCCFRIYDYMGITFKLDIYSGAFGLDNILLQISFRRSGDMWHEKSDGGF